MLVQLALPGDMVGMEALCAVTHTYSVSALVPAKVEPVSLQGEQSHYAALVKGLLQQQRQTLDMVRLRSGPISQRLAYLLTVLGKDTEGRVRPVQRTELPTLREMAQIVDSALETVCRELNTLMPKTSTRSGRTYEPKTLRNQSRWIRPASTAALAQPG